MSNLIQESELMEWSGYKRRNALINWLRANGIPYLLGNNGRVCVTSESVNVPLLIIQRREATSTDDIEFI